MSRDLTTPTNEQSEIMSRLVSECQEHQRKELKYSYNDMCAAYGLGYDNGKKSDVCSEDGLDFPSFMRSLNMKNEFTNVKEEKT